MEVTQSVEVIGPVVANNYLSANLDNRKLRPGHVCALADAMRRGEWKLTHQGIAFSESGRLLDGQHRLKDIIMAQRPVQLVVVRGLPEDAFLALDQGARRSSADVLGADQKAVEVANLAGSILTGANRITPQQVERLLRVIGPDHADLTRDCKQTTRYFSCAGMRLAAIVAARDFGSREYVYPIYRALVASDMDALPPICRAAVAQVASGKVIGGRGTGRVTSLDALARGWAIFDPEKAENRRVVVRDIATSIAWARNVLIAMGASA